ncbi:MAG: hypothetical protein AAGF11_55265 [Myxococcota bacterium]
MQLGLWVALATAAIAGCGASDDALGADTDDFIDVSTPPGNCSADTGAEPCPTPDSSGSPEGGPCINSDNCLDGGTCVAPFDNGEVGDFTCTSQCIGLADETRWCLDDNACCGLEIGAVCTARGLCVIPEEGLDSSGTGTADSSDTASSGGTGTAGSSDSGTGETEGSSGSSGTGAATSTATMG